MTNVDLAVEELTGKLRKKYGAAVRNIRLENVDEAGYWFSYELGQNSTQQTWNVRHWEVEEIFEKRKEWLLWCWENERTAEDEEWRDELTEEEQALVDSWDAGYSDAIADLCKRQGDM